MVLEDADLWDIWYTGASPFPAEVRQPVHVDFVFEMIQNYLFFSSSSIHPFAHLYYLVYFDPTIMLMILSKASRQVLPQNLSGNFQIQVYSSEDISTVAR